MNTLFYNYLISIGVDENHIIKFAFDSADDLYLIGESLIQIEKEKRLVYPEMFMAYIRTKVTDDEMYYLLLDEVQIMDCFEAVLNGYFRKNIWSLLTATKILAESRFCVRRGLYFVIY